MNKIIELKTGSRLSVRRLEKRDRQQLIKFNESLSEKSRNKFLPHAYDDKTVKTVLKRSDAHQDLLIGAFHKKQLVGYFFLWRVNTAIPVLGAGVADAFQNCGLGAKMIAMLIDYAKSIDSHGIMLTTLKSNVIAFNLYKKLGFKLYKEFECQTSDGRTNIELGMFFKIKPSSEPPESNPCSPIT